ncbi:hypothetical protein H4Q26_003355 [Puccinia striiformis f. sp. tritici PST-130]|nr:hypothetical protein Pst134EB_014342 [Puccinia striiformis f. sp. tritici]KAI9603755.1 hypothetical protein H4Q26_003355 [Puccinia striiformis f. sp. tritici PST-130]
MYLLLLALPISVLLVGVIYYKQAKAREQETEDPPIDGYYVYPAPLPHQNTLHPSQYWMAPGAVDPQGYPNYSQAFAPQPAPYQDPSRHPSLLHRSLNTPEMISGLQDARIRSPEKVAETGLSNVSNNITLEKVLVRDESSILLPTPSLNKQTVLSPTFQDYDWTQRDVQNIDQDHSKNVRPLPVRDDSTLLLPTPIFNKQTALSPIVQEYNWTKQDVEHTDQVHSTQVSPYAHSSPKDGPAKRLSDPSSVVKIDIIESFEATIFPEERIDQSSSHAREDCASESESVGSFPLSMRTVEPALGTGTALGREMSEELVLDIPSDERESGGEAGTEEVDLDADQTDVLPRYTSADAKIFERYKNRQSLKQDHSYIGRLRESYHAPETVPAPRRVIRDDNAYLNRTSPPSDPNSKP